MDELTNMQIERFMSSQDRARQIINMDRKGKLNEMANNLDIGFTDDNNDMSLDCIRGKYANQNQERQINEQVMTNSKLPKEILQSFKENKIDIGENKFLDEVVNKTVEEKRVVKQPIVEQQSTVGGQQIDYSMIKMIVEECMRKYTSSLKKSILNESKSVNEGNSLKAMKIGDKFSFIDDSGNLYEAKLTFVKNISKK